MTGKREGIKQHPKVPDWDTYPDKGCELYPTCLGNEEYPQCPFSKCVEDMSREEAKVLRKWFLGK